MKVLVTGAKGFVGKYVCKELTNRGHNILEFDTINGQDILNEEQLNQKMKGIGAIIHLAAIVENSNPNLWGVNVKGTTNVIEAANKARVKKIIFLSSTGIYGFTRKAVNEKTPVNAENNYEKSKIEGERIVLGAIKAGKIEGSVIRSAMIFGANKYWKSMFKMLEKKYPLPCNGKNKYQIIYVKELARAIALILTKGKNGEIYLASGKEKPTLNEFCEMVQEERGIEKGVKHIPSLIGILLGKIIGAKLLSFENIRHISKERNYDTRKIEKIGWKQKTTLKKAIMEVAKEFGARKND
ncbi:MAG: NAD(P)-dependent oxidoreductase [archaeon]